MKLRAATVEDAAAISEIYAPYVEGSVISFETTPPAPDEMAKRIEAGGGLYPWILAEGEAGLVAGYAYAAAFRVRPAYRFAVEISVYLAPPFQGRGIGNLLYRALLSTLEAQGYTQAIAAIVLPNAPSVRLHEALGFTPCGVYRQVGYKMSGWHDVGLWQRGLAPATNPPAEPRALTDIAPTY